MTGEDAIIKCCKENNLTIDGYFMLYMLHKGGYNEELETIKKNSHISFQALVAHEWINWWAATGDTELTDKGKALFEVNFGEDLYNTYPVTFPLSGGSSFVARTGGDKEVMIQLYHARIHNSAAEHAFAMKQLARYVKMVNTRKINGHKLIDWICNCMWEQIGLIPEDTSDFKTDV